jgi:UPF0176 protein
MPLARRRRAVLMRITLPPHMKSLTTNRPDAALKARGTAPAILNISTYKFVQLDGLEALRASLLEHCVARGLKGTVLLAPEGINVFLAGSRAGVHAVLDWLREDTRFVDLEPKESWSHGVPFKRMRVRLKREIITMNRPLIKPHAGRAPAVAPATVRQWLDQGHDDEGRRVLMLDTRNTFEIDVGTFDGAIDWRISKFSEFPPLAERYAGELAPYRVVSFCTGGIRCEKAAIVLQEAGVPHAVQLDGGILKYLELEGKPHWKGECFVFDERAALDAELQAAIDVAAESRPR